MDYPGKVITKTQVTPTQTSASGNWTLDDQAAAIKNNNWPVALVPNPISKSLRFNSADTAYLNRTFGTSTNQSIFTYSVWVKLGRTVEATTNYGSLLSGYTASSDTGFAEFHFYSGTLRFGGWATNWRVTTQVFRDPSSWYHVVLAVDTTQATAANRIKMYVNGSEITAFSTNNNPTQNSTVGINNNSTTRRIGQDAPASSSRLFDGYMAEANFIDGQALTPSSFGMTNPQTGQWIPLKYSGTYGTNGFYLNFKDATSTTTLGYDYSGNANNWTTNNFSVTAGAGNDSLTDVPTPWFAYNTTGDVGGVFRGNYATMNPVASVTTPPTFTNGNLEVTGPSSGVGATVSTFGGTSNKFYVEVTVTRASDRLDLGIAGSLTASTFMTSTNYLGTDTNTIGYITSTGVIRKDNANNQTGLATCTTGDVVGMAINMDSGTIQFYKNNSTVGTAVSFTFSAYGSFLVAQTTSFNTSKGTYNFGQRPFAYTPPTGFRSLCTTNLPATAIGFGLTNQGDDYMNVALYTGNGSSQSITSVGFQPDFTWIKSRSGADNHNLFNSVVGLPNRLFSNLTNAENTTAGTLTSFNSDGFSVGSISDVNANAVTFVGWNWKASGSTVSNTAGTITSTVSANTTARFSVVTWTGNGSTGTIGHGLSATPNLIIVKARTQSAARNWKVYSSVLGAGQTLNLNDTSAAGADTTIWNNTSPTSTVFSVGASNSVNENTYTYVAYCFAAVPGYSAFGSYTGNGSTDGPFVYTGFRPRYLMVKRTNSTGDWIVLDTARDTYNLSTKLLYPNLSNAEETYDVTDLLSNGFKQRNVFGALNASGSTYIYAAFAEFPFQFANAR